MLKKEDGRGRPPVWRLRDGNLAKIRNFHVPVEMVPTLRMIAHKMDDGVFSEDELLQCVDLLERLSIDEIKRMFEAVTAA
jgi:hypothetical protein